MKKILVLGSGALKIGEGGEFDYSGSQAVKAIKEDGIETILVNPNIATIQTSKFMADKVYFLPVNSFFVEKIIKKEKPDAVLLSFGGQTALNCAIDLHKSGVLKRNKVKILGTPISAIILSEDRKKFASHLRKIDIPTPPGKTANKINDARKIAKELGFPVMVRSGFSLGGQGSGIAKNLKDLGKIAQKALSFAPQILIEKYLHRYKEVEYEVVRDKNDNCITVCNMENMDPLGIHTGESIVVAPSQTLNNFEYYTLREKAIKIVRSLKIVGECNVQFALNPLVKNLDYYVIELNARLSRSSALASKATGYPLAYVAAKLALGYSLTEIKNKVTLTTQSCFEPALDYIVVKIPRWDIEKFKGAEEEIGTSMKSVGEVMGIGRTFEEAYQKAIRMLDLDFEGATSKSLLTNGLTLEEKLKPTPKRMFAIALAIEKGVSVKKIYDLTGIDTWFLYRIKNIVLEEKNLKTIKNLTPEKLWKLKQLGFSDRKIGERVGTTGLEIRALRKKLKVLPSIFQIDTLGGEFPAKTNYLYLTYNGNHSDVDPLKKKGVIVLGSGPYRIGSSVEFDWTTVNTSLSLKKHSKKSIMINCNPETVSTDFDISDRLYFEELTFERIADIYDFENPYGMIVSVGGQTPNNRAHLLKKSGVNILGTDPKNIEKAENRNKFSKLLDKLAIKQPAWDKFSSVKSAIAFCEQVGYPVLIRPSFILSGTMMRICHDKDDLIYFLKNAARISNRYTITVSKFVEDASEIELDAVAQKGELIVHVVSEHVENAGVHSGDASIVLPPRKTNLDIQRQIKEIGQELAKELKITGPFNIQFLEKNRNLQVIEVNLRSSRTFPFISKVMNIDLIGLCVDSFFGKKIQKVQVPPINFTAVKVAQFSFARMTRADPIVHVEMASTGEVACFGEDVEEAFLKSELAVGGKIPKRGVFISLGTRKNKIGFIDSARKLYTLGIPIYSTEKTAMFFFKNGIKTKKLYKLYERKSPNVLELFRNGQIDLAINIVDSYTRRIVRDDYSIRRSAIDLNIPLFTNMQKAELFVNAIYTKDINSLSIKAWGEYI